MHGTVKMALELWNAMTFHHFNLSPMVVCAKRSGTIACFSCNGVVIFVNRKKVDHREPKCCCCCCCCCMMMRWWRRGGGGSSKKKKPSSSSSSSSSCIHSLLSVGISEKSTYFISNIKTAVFISLLKQPKIFWKNESGQKCGKTTFISGKVFYRFLFVLFLKRKTEDQIR